MTLSRVEVITSVERRRRWPRAEKERLVALAPVDLDMTTVLTAWRNQTS